MKGGKSKADTSKKADTKLSVKKKASDTVIRKPAKKAKAEKDPNKPKRPPSAFFVFMEEFREQYKKKNPNVKQVSVIGKASGDKWRSMSDSDKAPYVAKANKLKVDYDKKITSYNKQQSEAENVEEEEGSDKSKSEVHDEDEDGSEEDDEEDE